MNKTQINCTAIFSVFAAIGFGPVSPGCLIGMFVVLTRPTWFLNVAAGLYANKPMQAPQSVTEYESKQAIKKAFFSLLALFVIDIAPIPVTPIVAFFIIFTRPAWFYRLIASIYANPPGVTGS